MNSGKTMKATMSRSPNGSRTSQTRTGNLGKRIWKHRAFYVFLLPTIIFIALFQYMPFYWLQIAFRDFSFIDFAAGGMSANPVAGFKYFMEVINNADFLRILRNTFAISLLSLVFAFPIPVIFALVINEIRAHRFKKVMQTITYLPHFVSWVVVAGLFYFVLDKDTGSVNNFLEFLGLERIPFFRRADLFWPIMLFSTIWKNTGWSSIIYLSALTGVDQEMYEAARIDGATKWQEIRFITIPSIMPTIIVVLIITTGRIVSGGGIIPDFEAIFNMGNSMVSSTAETIAIHTYNYGMLMGKYSYATAFGIFQSAIAFIFVFGSNRLSKRVQGYGAL